MADHAVGIYQFIDWQGDLPQFVGQDVRQFNRVGLSGSGFHLTGEHGVPFTAELVAHTNSLSNAKAAVYAMQNLRQLGPQNIVYANTSYLSTYGHLYKIMDVTELECRMMPAVIGPGYAYTPGVRLVVAVTMVPIRA